MIRKMLVFVLAASFCAAFEPSTSAQGKKGERLSPHDKVSATLGGKAVTIEYGRPYLKGRSVGKEVAPYGQVWRTGADEATTLVTEVDLKVGGLAVPKGNYTMFTLPTEKEWKLIINKVPSQWGAFTYKQDQDLGRVDMKLAAAAAPVEQLTITLDKASETKATLKIAWGATVVTVPVEVQ